MDPLSDVLAHLNTRSSYFTGLRAGGDWALDFPPPEGIKFNAVMKGRCWLRVEGVEEPVELQTGDCFLLTQPRTFTLASDLSVKADDAYVHYSASKTAVVRYADSTHPQALFLVGGRYTFNDEAQLLLDNLPVLMLIVRGSSPAGVLHWALEQLSTEIDSSLPGAAMMSRQLGQMMLVQVLRQYLSSQHASPAGWLSALSDSRVNAALSAMHADPARRWTLIELAEIAGVSRSTFALSFKQKVGYGPLEYLIRWRMQLASRRLRNPDERISSIGQSLGYDSDSAFSHAFKRIMSCSPKQYRQQAAEGAAD
ncbi:AraC family transcriptional regulator [Rouxiella badensis]|uniref:AraC family transcriptional regulator n=1 Tax=Rouxiella badensis TaxID=1646377 RepID=UPI0013EEFA21|nr:AraC family transcriptional regulator [Rouxiella badensis]QII38008.1 AraC family transcriptional regulator [Rouxiella badensis]